MFLCMQLTKLHTSNDNAARKVKGYVEKSIETACRQVSHFCFLTLYIIFACFVDNFSELDIIYCLSRNTIDLCSIWTQFHIFCSPFHTLYEVNWLILRLQVP